MLDGYIPCLSGEAGGRDVQIVEKMRYVNPSFVPGERRDEYEAIKIPLRYNVCHTLAP